AKFGVPALVALNRFPSDTDAELTLVRQRCEALGVKVVLSEVFTKGGEGGAEMAHAVVELCEQGSDYRPLYDAEQTLHSKIETIAKEIYRADGVDLAPAAATQLGQLNADGYGLLPVCMAKSQYSFSDDPTRLGA